MPTLTLGKRLAASKASLYETLRAIKPRHTGRAYELRGTTGGYLTKREWKTIFAAYNRGVPQNKIFSAVAVRMKKEKRPFYASVSSFYSAFFYTRCSMGRDIQKCSLKGFSN